MNDKSESRSSSDLREIFDDQLDHMKATARLFDGGQHGAYRRLATSIRIFVRKSRMSHPLLEQMQLDRRGFLSCARSPEPLNKLNSSDLISFFVPQSLSGKARWFPTLDRWSMEFVPLEQWWTSPVLADGQGTFFSRSDLVLTVADQDGGAHVDPVIDRSFQKMRKEAFNWSNGKEVTQHPDRYAIRSIAHELIKSLDPRYSISYKANEPAGVFIRGLVFAAAGVPLRTKIPSYHLSSPDNPCGCLSGKSFRECHMQGSVPPMEAPLSHTTVIAPPDAAFARIQLSIKPNSV